MKRISATTRLAFSLTGLLVSLLLFGNLFGLFPDAKSMTLRSRTQLSEAIAIGFAGQATLSDSDTVHAILKSIQSRNPEIASVGVRQADGSLLAQAGPHEDRWQPRTDGKSTLTAISVPLGTSNGQWGSVEVAYKPLSESGGAMFSQLPPLAATGCLGVLTFCLYMVYLRFALRALNPSKVVPKRVNEALNTLTEGLLVLDKNERIVLANTSFAAAAGVESDSLLGKKVSDLPWQARDTKRSEPWRRSMEEGSPESGVLLELEMPGREGRTYSVNAVPIADDKGNCRGALASFEDVTEIERKTVEMSRMLDKLRKTAKQINRQNRELERLATRDPLTNCLNRRAFFDNGEQLLRAGERYHYPVSVIMLDVDHFKAVNDNHGHSMGDEVLQRVGTTLLKLSRESDLVCRYGGEEFSILLPHIDIQGATEAAERIRVGIAELDFDGLQVTASFGVTDRGLGGGDIQGMLDQADRSLYAAKKNGRNRVVRYDRIGDYDNLENEAESPLPVSLESPLGQEVEIPYRAVTALLAAMAFRDRATAEHSRRVADLCVLIAEDLVSRRRCYVIEMAALLHDIGKVGVPDSILLKPGKLTKDEWQIMQKHDLIGAEIIRASFASSELSTIVESHHLSFSGTMARPDAAQGMDIPLGARILTIADAYDAITSDRVYSRGRTQEEAFAELRRFAGSQFDPDLVEHFIAKISIRKTATAVQFGVSKETALGIGLQLERLVASIDDRDLSRLATLNTELARIASENAVDSVANKSEELRVKLETADDLIDILYTAGELLDVCRQTQTSFFEGSEFRAPVGEVEPVLLAE